MATVVTRIPGATQIIAITGSIVVWDHVIIRVPASSGAMLEAHGDIVEAIPLVVNQRTLNRDRVYQTTLVENMVHIIEVIGAMLMPTRTGIIAAVQNHLATTMGKVTNGVTLQTISTSGITVFDCKWNSISGLKITKSSITRNRLKCSVHVQYIRILLENPHLTGDV